MLASNLPFHNQAVKDVLRKYESAWSMYHAQGLMGWDLEVCMPEKGARPRGVAMAQVALMAQRATLELKPALAEAAKADGMNDAERGVVRVLERDLDYFQKVPPELIEEVQKLSAEATVVWRSARKNSDFSTFKPYLEKIVALKRQEAEKLGYQKHPYNALLDQYEEGLTVADADGVFSRLVPELRRIFHKVEASGRFAPVSSLESQRYDTESMRRVNEKVIELLGMPKDRFRMDVSTHPFTSGTSIDDVRITTRYEGTNFKAAMYSTAHECGHAIYQLQTSPDLLYSPIERGASLGVHESQSRFWENIIGRSKEFVRMMMPTLRENLPFVGSYTEDQVYTYFNSVKASMIRVDADELTYNFHIALRYDIEKKLIAGEASPSELPQLWGDTLESYLGVRPNNDAEGVLQDVHWSGASIGYFPTYSMGNVISGIIWKAMGGRDRIADMVQKGEFGNLRNWLEEKIHRYGATYPPKDLLKRSFGTGYDPEPLVAYLEQKYTS